MHQKTLDLSGELENLQFAIERWRKFELAAEPLYSFLDLRISEGVNAMGASPVTTLDSAVALASQQGYIAGLRAARTVASQMIRHFQYERDKWLSSLESPND